MHEEPMVGDGTHPPSPASTPMAPSLAAPSSRTPESDVLPASALASTVSSTFPHAETKAKEDTTSATTEPIRRFPMRRA
jgi:hypothetical protein